jgi:multidrug efflux pump subunit AcrA (membrane-fusion protein)
MVGADEGWLARAQALDQTTTLTSPLDGMVGEINMTVGQVVIYSDIQADVVVIGSGGVQVSVQVPTTDLGLLHLGTSGTVTPLGSSTTYKASIASIGTTPTVNKITGLVSLPVTLEISNFRQAVFDGSYAQVVLSVSTKSRSLAVPTSAVSVNGSKQSVELMTSQGTTRIVPVRVLTVGSTYTAISSEILKPGESVVLAYENQAIPASSGLSTRALRKSLAG